MQTNFIKWKIWITSVNASRETFVQFYIFVICNYKFVTTIVLRRNYYKKFLVRIFYILACYTRFVYFCILKVTVNN